MRLADFLTPDPITVGPQDELGKAVELMDEHDIRHLPVVAGGALVGMLSDRDLLAATGWKPSRLARWRNDVPGLVSDLMGKPPTSAGPDDDLAGAAKLMIERRIRGLPVLEGERLIGIVTDYDVLIEYVKACRAQRLGDRDDPAVSECMTWSVEKTERKTTVADAFSHLHRADVLHLPVVEGDALFGIVSDRDFRLHIGRGVATSLPVDAICSKDVVTISAQERLSGAADLMVLHKIGAVPVTSERTLLGMLSSTDVLAVCATARWGTSGGA